MLYPIERPEQGESAGARWGHLDVELEVLALGEPREAAVGAVADDRPHAREIVQAIAQELAGGHDIVRPGRARPGGDGQPEDFDE